ncbi:hypothetical protein P170DRAFT_64809 [Aspergillus steynii IBT 23096]|uniref:Uncharacterized protein n=1 Tax=Aspergillus steynii IBT 23096 TaxID=1392250 RepID=A0A2I2FTE2_9EURO|nr:uncharacterized protein P170DRAFT_64809 [Aspergillus steynii IBT 23096]PLB43910.1 hypothetical protein P170DRAFT_64809 [Aspergillus steynii IBT 23096]
MVGRGCSRLSESVSMPVDLTLQCGLTLNINLSVICCLWTTGSRRAMRLIIQAHGETRQPCLHGSLYHSQYALLYTASMLRSTMEPPLIDPSRYQVLGPGPIVIRGIPLSIHCAISCCQLGEPALSTVGSGRLALFHARYGCHGVSIWVF